jgi:hypothetical protein
MRWMRCEGRREKRREGGAAHRCCAADGSARRAAARRHASLSAATRSSASSASRRLAPEVMSRTSRLARSWTWEAAPASGRLDGRVSSEVRAFGPENLCGRVAGAPWLECRDGRDPPREIRPGEWSLRRVESASVECKSRVKWILASHTCAAPFRCASAGVAG